MSKLCSMPFRGFNFWSKPSVQFQVVSDLHLEHCSQYTSFQIPVRAPYLILAGDIGRLADYDLYLDFLATLAKQFRRVFLVLGETEYFGASHKHGKHIAYRIQQEPVLEGRVALLQRKRFDIGSDVTLLGCTLNTNIPKEGHGVVSSRVKDFKQISDWTVANHVLEHQIDVEWLENEVHILRKEKGPNHKIVVITHHAPTIGNTLTPDHEQYAETVTYGTSLLGKGSYLDEVQTWIFGHTGLSVDSRSGNTRLISNQRGVITPFEDNDTAQTKEFKPGLLGKLGRKKHIFDVGKVIHV